MTLREEVSIPMPWGGILSGQFWGKRNGYPTLCLHGYNDNSASFDHLLPHLTKGTRCFLAIDLPGHGKSSHYPPFHQVSFLDFIADMKRICDHYSWSKIDIIAHSLRNQLALYFASIFSDLVMKVVSLDMISGEVVFESDHFYELAVHEVKSFLRFSNSSVSKNWLSEDEALRKFMDGRIAEIKKEYLLPIFHRNIKKYDDKVCFTNDKRNAYFLTPLITYQSHEALVFNIRCPVLIIMSHLYKTFLETSKSSYLTLTLLQTKLGNKLTMKETSFSHDMHIEYPSEIASIINNYVQGLSYKL